METMRQLALTEARHEVAEREAMINTQMEEMKEETNEMEEIM